MFVNLQKSIILSGTPNKMSELKTKTKTQVNLNLYQFFVQYSLQMAFVPRHSCRGHTLQLCNHYIKLGLHKLPSLQ